MSQTRWTHENGCSFLVSDAQYYGQPPRRKSHRVEGTRFDGARIIKYVLPKNLPTFLGGFTQVDDTPATPSTPAETDFSDLEFAEVTITPEQHTNLIARIRGTASVAALALALTLTPPVGCTIVGNTGSDEAFPVAHCADGSYVYQDMDGSKDRAPGTWTDATVYTLHNAH